MGAALTVLAAGVLLLAIGGRSGASAQSSLTVNVPAPVTDRIYGAPGARGRPIVVIDPGHGGRDPGATSVSGQVSEKDLTLALARELRDDLVKRGRVRVALTRDGDRYWYESYLDPSTLATVQAQTLTTIIKRNAAIGREVQDDAFHVPESP